MSATLELVKKTVAKVTHSNESDISGETQLKDIKADSLDWVQIMVGIENALDIEIDTEKMKDMTAIGDLVKYLDDLKK
jgi:acyl carrier protein